MTVEGTGHGDAMGHVRYRVWPALAVTTVAVGCIAILAYIVNAQVSDEMLVRYQREQINAVSQQAERLDVVIRGIVMDLDALSRHQHILDPDEDLVRRLLRDLFARHSDFLIAASFMDGNGVIRYAEGIDRTGEGKAIGHQEHVVKMFERKRPVVSGSFRAVQGYDAIAIHAPILVAGEVRGSVSATVNWSSFRALFSQARTSPGSFMALLDPRGRVIYHPRDEFIGRTLDELPALTDDSGPVTLDFFTQPNAAVVNGPFLDDQAHVVASMPLEVQGEVYSLFVCAPYSDVLEPMARFSRLLGLLAGLAFLVIASGVAYLTLVFHRDKQRSRSLHSELERKIDELRHAERKLRLFREVFVNSQDAITIADEKGVFLEQNAAHRTLTGYSMEDLRGKTPTVHLGDAAYEEILARLRAGGVFRREIPIRTKDGRARVIDLSAFTVPGGAGEETYHVGISRDVTDRRDAEHERARLEDQLRQSEKLRAIGQLAGGIAHDFNNQLTGIYGYAEILRDRLDDPRLKNAAEMILAASRRSADLTQQLLAYARKGRLKSVAVSLHAVIEDVTAILGRSLDKRIRIDKRLGAARHTVIGDPTQLQNAVLNLALNARDAMAAGGDMTFETKIVDLAGDDLPEGGEPGPYLQLEVRDTGVGIDSAIRDRIFEPFFTTKGAGEGTGMGLAAVYGTVTGHGGTIHARGAAGGGTEIVVRLPLAQTEVVAASEAPAEPAAHGTGHILAVDDEEIVLDLLAAMLERLGYRVTTCLSGREAVDRYRELRDDVDLVLMDLIMPDMGGRETFAALREIDEHVRVVLMTGFSVGGEAQQLLDAGALGLIQKPFRQADLARALAGALS